MADEAASFSIEMFFISWGLISLIAQPATPSITTSGSALFNVPTPRIRIVEVSKPGVFPPELVTVSPEANPARAFSALVTGRSAKASMLTEETAPERFAFFCEPYPTITTSSNFVRSSYKVRRIFSRALTSRVLYPIKEMRNGEPNRISGNLNSPLRSVTCPVPLSLISTFTPIKGSPAASVTRPLAVMIRCFFNLSFWSSNGSGDFFRLSFSA